MNYKVLVTEFYYGFETAANERTRSVMLASTHVVYEVRTRMEISISTDISVLGFYGYI